MIVEQRDYQVFTGKLVELVRLYEQEGIALQQEFLGGLIGVFTTDVGALSTYTSLWRYDNYAEREERRAKLQADDANCGACGNACAGGQTCKGGKCAAH